ncbi:MAG: hypothetical protein AAF310_00735 [Myxococcota bacterium]
MQTFKKVVATALGGTRFLTGFLHATDPEGAALTYTVQSSDSIVSSVTSNGRYQLIIDTDSTTGVAHKGMTYTVTDTLGNNSSAFMPITIVTEDSQQFLIDSVDNSLFTPPIEQPQVAALPDGEFVAVWSAPVYVSNDYIYQIYAQRYTAKGEPIYKNATQDPTPIVVNTNTNISQYSPAVATFANGNFVVVWQSANPLDNKVFAQLFDIAGNPLNTDSNMPQDIEVSNDATGRYLSAKVAVLSDHDFVVVWRSSQSSNPGGESNWRAYGRLLTKNSDTGLYQPDDVFEIYNQSGIAVQTLEAAALRNQQGEDGRFVVAWETTDASDVFANRNVYYRLCNREGCFTVSQTVNTQVSNAALPGFGVGLAALPNGDFMVAWQSPNGDNSTDVLGRRYLYKNGSFSDEFQVNSRTLEYQDEPAISSLPNGGYVVTWNSINAVKAQVFDNTNQPVGNEFMVNLTQGLNKSSSIATLTNGELVVAWKNSFSRISGRLISATRHLQGGADNDLLATGFSQRALTGGAGQDDFMVETNIAQQHAKLFHVVTDFDLQEDRLILNGLNPTSPLSDYVAIIRADAPVGDNAASMMDAAVHMNKNGGMSDLSIGDLNELSEDSGVITVFLQNLGNELEEVHNDNKETSLQNNLQKFFGQGALVVP